MSQSGSNMPKSRNTIGSIMPIPPIESAHEAVYPKPNIHNIIVIIPTKSIPRHLMIRHSIIETQTAKIGRRMK